MSGSDTQLPLHMSQKCEHIRNSSIADKISTGEANICWAG